MTPFVCIYLYIKTHKRGKFFIMMAMINKNSSVFIILCIHQYEHKKFEEGKST